MTTDNDIEHDPRWAAVIARDRRADGAFVYSVASTGIYCRPGCGARTPRPDNVRFHDDAAAAEQAGFRACRRCRPDEPANASPHAAAIAAACRSLEQAETAPSLAELAQAAGLSPHHFHRVFRAATGLTPRAYAAAARARAMRDELPAAPRVIDAVFDAGYGSASRFYAEADAILGMSPARYRDGGKGAVIRYATARCSLGEVLVGASDTGVCAILMGEDAAALVQDLYARFPAARLIPGGEDFADTVTRVVALVEAPRLGLDLPLDLRGTAFQQRVWDALRRIAPGRTASYADIARAIGAPGAMRAVAQACAGNPLAIAIPCHRVVRSDGGLSGYRWGPERKRALLERERAQPEGA